MKNVSTSMEITLKQVQKTFSDAHWHLSLLITYEERFADFGCYLGPSAR